MLTPVKPWSQFAVQLALSRSALSGSQWITSGWVAFLPPPRFCCKKQGCSALEKQFCKELILRWERLSCAVSIQPKTSTVRLLIIYSVNCTGTLIIFPAKHCLKRHHITRSFSARTVCTQAKARGDGKTPKNATNKIKGCQNLHIEGDRLAQQSYFDALAYWFWSIQWRLKDLIEALEIVNGSRSR